MNLISKTLIVSCALALATLAPAQRLAGTWNGKMTITPNFPANTPPEQKKMALSQIAMINKMKLLLTLSANKSYNISITGGPQGTDQKETGTWAVSGKTLTLTPKEKKPNSQTPPMTISKDGKTLTAQLPPNPRAKMTLIFKR